MTLRMESWMLSLLVGLVIVAGCSTDATPVAQQQTPEKPQPPAAVQSASTPLPSAKTVAPSPEAEAAIKQLQQLYNQASTAETEFRFPEAVNYWKQTLVLLEKIHGPGSWQLRNGKLALATAETQSGFSSQQLERLKSLVAAQKEIAERLSVGDYATGLKIARQTAPATSDLFGSDSWMKAKQDVQCARLEQMAGNTDEAVRMFQAASGQILQHAGTVHPELETIHAYLAECFTQSGNSRMALANFSKATALAESLWGSNSLQFASRANDLGVSYNTAGDYSTSVRILRVSESIRLKSLGESHPLVAHSRLNLSIAYMGIGEMQLAYDFVKQAEAIFRSMPSGQDLLVQALRQKSATLMLSGNPDQAELPLAELVKIAETANDGGRLAAEYKYRLAVCLGRQGKFTEASDLLQKALEVRSQLLGANNADTVKTRELLVQMLDRANQPTRAAEAGGSVRPASFTMPDSNK